MEDMTPTCETCRTELHGRADRRYCSPACRQAAYRRRPPQHDTPLGLVGERMNMHPSRLAKLRREVPHHVKHAAELERAVQTFVQTAEALADIEGTHVLDDVTDADRDRWCAELRYARAELRRLEKFIRNAPTHKRNGSE